MNTTRTDGRAFEIQTDTIPTASKEYNELSDVSSQTSFGGFFVGGLDRPVQVKAASRPREWEAAFRLVKTSYVSRGYELADGNPLRFTPFNALSDSTTFIAKQQSQVIATLSLIFDNPLLGLPLEILYKAEIEQLRKEGRRLVEVTSLADTGLGLREFTPIFTALMRIMAQSGVCQGATTWVIVVNPRHSRFYSKVLGFQQFGERKDYPSVQNHPAEAFLLEPELMKKHSPEMYDKLFGRWLPQKSLLAPRIPHSLVHRFSQESGQFDAETLQRIFSYEEEFGSTRLW